MSADRHHLQAVPDAAARDASDRFYEFLLSDHPAAVAERARRSLDTRMGEAEDRARLEQFVTRTRNDPDAPDSVRRLAATAEGLIGKSRQRDQEFAAVNTPEHLARAREGWEISQRVGGPGGDGYRYPVRYLGQQAARQPIPADPDHWPVDHEAVASLGQRAAAALRAESHPAGWMRERAITDRTRADRDRERGGGERERGR